MTEPITSPTFTLVHSYDTAGKITLHHADLYRLDQLAEVADLALGELAEFDGIVLVEWGDVVVESTFGDHLVARALETPSTTTTRRRAGSRSTIGAWGGAGALTGARAATVTARRSRIVRRHADPRHRDGDRAGERRPRRSRGRDRPVRGRPRPAPRRDPHAGDRVRLRQADIGLDELGLIAVDVGPGLFTGMRVGLAAAKALAQALRVPMIGISSLDLLAFPHRQSDRVVVPVIDARKGEVFYAMYRPGAGRRAAGRRRHGSARSTSSSPTCWPAARRRCASATGRCATDARSSTGYHCEFADEGPSVGRPARAARPRQGAARGVGQPAEIRADLPAASPTPRSTGRAGQPRGQGGRVMSMLERMLDRP